MKRAHAAQKHGVIRVSRAATMRQDASALALPRGAGEKRITLLLFPRSPPVPSVLPAFT